MQLQVEALLKSENRLKEALDLETKRRIELESNASKASAAASRENKLVDERQREVAKLVAELEWERGRTAAAEKARADMEVESKACMNSAGATVNNELKSQLLQATQTVQTLTAALDDAKASLTGTIQRLSSDSVEERNMCRQMQIRIRDLEQALERNSLAANNGVEDAIQAAETEITKIACDLAQARQNVNLKEDRIKEMEMALKFERDERVLMKSTVDLRVVTLEETVAFEREELNRVRIMLIEAESVVTAERERADDQASVRVELQVENEHMSEHVEKLERALENSMEGGRHLIKAETAERESLEDKLKETYGELIEAKIRISKLDEERKMLKKEVDDQCELLDRVANGDAEATAVLKVRLKSTEDVLGETQGKLEKVKENSKRRQLELSQAVNEFKSEALDKVLQRLEKKKLHSTLLAWKDVAGSAAKAAAGASTETTMDEARHMMTLHREPEPPNVETVAEPIATAVDATSPRATSGGGGGGRSNSGRKGKKNKE